MKKLTETTLLLICFLSIEIVAQYGSIGSADARSMGMAKTYSATTTGIFSIGINPANLAFNNDAAVQFTTILPVPNLSVRGGSNFISIDDFNYYFGGIDGERRVLDEADKDNLYGIFENGGSVFANAGARLLTFGFSPKASIGFFALSVSDYSGGKAFVPEALADFSLNGNPQGKVFDISQSSFSTWWIRQYSISYAKELPEVTGKVIDKFALGITVKLVHGFAYMGTDKVSTFLTTSDKNIITGDAELLAYSSFSDNFGVEYEYDTESKASNLNPFPSPAGVGYGADVGFTFGFGSRWKLAFAVTDIGNIIWNDNAAQFSSDGPLLLDDITSKSQRDSVVDLVLGTAQPIDKFTTPLAMALRLGASVIVSDHNEIGFPGRLILAFDYNQGFNEMPGNTITPRFSIGAEWKPADYVPYLRSGFEFLGIDGFNWAFGLGFDLNVLEIHIASSSMQTVLLPFPSNRISFSVSSRWKI